MTSWGSNSKRKAGKLTKHFSSKAHKSALADFYAFSHDLSNVDMLLNKEKCVNAIQEEDHLVNEGATCILLDVAITLARQGLGFRGSSTHEHGESDERKKDPFAVVVMYVKEDSSTFVVKEHLLEIRETTEKTSIGQANDILKSMAWQFPTWFSSRMIMPLICHGLCHEAQAEIERKLQRKVPYIHVKLIELTLY